MTSESAATPSEGPKRRSFWRKLETPFKSRLFVAALGVLGSLLAFLYGKWVERPNIAIHVASLKQEVPDEIPVWLPLEPDLLDLAWDLPTWYLLNKPDMFRALTSLYPTPPPPQVSALPDQPFVGISFQPRAIPIPPSLMRLTMAEARQLQQTADVPTDVIRQWQQQLEKHAALLKPEEAATAKVFVDAMLERAKNRKAKARLDALESDWKAKYGLFLGEVVVTNSGGRAVSLASPETLRFFEGKDSAECQMFIKPGNQPVTILPNESKRVTIVSPRADSQTDQINRPKMQQRWSVGGQCSVEFTDSNGRVRSSDAMPFVPR